MRHASLRLRITSWYVSLLAAALLVFGGAVYAGVQRYLTMTTKAALNGDAHSIASNFLSQYDQKGATWVGGEVMEAYGQDSPGRFIRISLNGVPFYESGDLRTDHIDPATIGRVGGLSRPAFREQRFNSTHRMLIYALPYRSAGGASLAVEVGTSLDTSERILHSLSLTLLLATPVILLIAAVGGSLMMRAPLRPVVELTERAENIGRDALGARLPVIRTGDELERLALSLNRMIGRLEDALAHNHRFSADASHELRTPLTIVRGELEEVALLPNLPADAVSAVGSALEEIERMSRIIQSLLAISRLDGGGETMKMAPLDLGELARSTVEQMHLLAEEKQIRMMTKIARGVVVDGDAARLKQVVVNLLDNAIKYTPHGGRVTLHVSREGERAVLAVEDRGIGIPQESLPLVFERFYRTDKARSRESGGTGLGLSIVKSICVAHQGEVSVTSTEGAGSTFRVTLPLMAAEKATQNAVAAGQEVMLHRG